MPNYNYLLPASLSAPAPTNALAQPRMVNYGALAVNQQPAPGSDDAIYQMFQSLAKQGAANRSGGVRVNNPMTQEEKDLINHPSVQWLKKQGEESRRQFETEMMPYLGKKYTLPNNWEADNGEDPNKFISTMPNRVDPEYARHAEIVGELAKRNPNVLYEAGILNRGVSRYAPGEFNQEIPDEKLTNPMRNYRNRTGY